MFTYTCIGFESNNFCFCLEMLTKSVKSFLLLGRVGFDSDDEKFYWAFISGSSWDCESSKKVPSKCDRPPKVSPFIESTQLFTETNFFKGTNAKRTNLFLVLVSYWGRREVELLVWFFSPFSLNSVTFVYEKGMHWKMKSKLKIDASVASFNVRLARLLLRFVIFCGFEENARDCH